MGFPSSNFKTLNLLIIEIIKFPLSTNYRSQLYIWYANIQRVRGEFYYTCSRYWNLFSFPEHPACARKSGTSTVCLSRCSIAFATWRGIAFGAQFFWRAPLRNICLLLKYGIRQKLYTFSPSRILCRISSEIFLDRQFAVTTINRKLAIANVKIWPYLLIKNIITRTINKVI